MAVLLVIRHQVNNAGVIRVWETCALLIRLVEVGVSCTDDIR